ISFHDLTGQDTGYFYAKVRYWDENGTQTNVSGVSLQRKTDADGRYYYVLKLSQPINAKKIQFGLARYSASGTITISEVYFYYYDTLMDEIMSLYEDDLHTILRAEVTQADIDALRVKINTIDEVSGEYHPDRKLLERELQTAEAILNDRGLNDSVIIYNGITTKDVNRGFGGLNAWQPLGVVAAAQEEIMVYVGSGSGKTGDAANLQLVATQYHAESGTVSKVVTSLKVGPNKVTVPKLWSTTGVESGGALYVQYTGNNNKDQYAVRVSGGVQVPRLDLYQVTDSAERLARTVSYVEQLQAYVEHMEETHKEFHADYAYDVKNCILGATDILLDTMMLSLPAQQILNGAGSGSVQEKAQKILGSMDAMEEMMYLFYQHKGLNANAADAVNQIPKGHLNIRYQRMFSGAFMYASGNHIGIEWGSTTGMVTAVPVVADSEGRYQSGSYFGWGIAHEIGHCINQGTYAIAEITNNYFAVLAQAKDSNNSVRFKYDNVYKKVTSGAKGMASNVFTQLGMYWQLHLAYDNGSNYKTYEDYNEQLENLFFARVDTYAR
ncbi:MAG: M60 family metallopeptidase, partial [Acetatifactor sp.]|nr:M60 family metallopeptidase [Acetatifactor sp.]